jgi:hypothetical protein
MQSVLRSSCSRNFTIMVRNTLYWGTCGAARSAADAGSSSSSSSSALAAGAAIGGIAIIILVAAVVVIVMRRRRGKDQSAQAVGPMLFDNPLFMDPGQGPSRVERSMSLKWLSQDGGAPVELGESNAMGLPVYFHGQIARPEVERRLVASGLDGDFIVTHDHVSDRMAVAVLFDSRVRHAAIDLSVRGYTCGGVGTADCVHATVQSLQTARGMLPTRLGRGVAAVVDDDYRRAVCVRNRHGELHVPVLCSANRLPASVEVLQRVTGTRDASAAGFSAWSGFPQQPYVRLADVALLQSGLYDEAESTSTDPVEYTMACNEGGYSEVNPNLEHPYASATDRGSGYAPVVPGFYSLGASNEDPYSTAVQGFYSILPATGADYASAGAGFYSIGGSEGAGYSEAGPGFYSLGAGGDEAAYARGGFGFYTLGSGNEGGYQELHPGYAIPRGDGYTMATDRSGYQEQRVNPYAMASDQGGYQELSANPYATATDNYQELSANPYATATDNYQELSANPYASATDRAGYAEATGAHAHGYAKASAGSGYQQPSHGYALATGAGEYQDTFGGYHDPTLDPGYQELPDASAYALVSGVAGAGYMAVKHAGAPVYSVPTAEGGDYMVVRRNPYDNPKAGAADGGVRRDSSQRYHNLAGKGVSGAAMFAVPIANESGDTEDSYVTLAGAGGDSHGYHLASTLAVNPDDHV